MKKNVLWKNVLIFSAYFLSAELGFMIDAMVPGASLIWLPSGFAMFFVARWGYNIFPGIYLAAYAVNVKLLLGMAGLSLQQVWLTPYFSAMGNAVQPMLGYWLLTRKNPPPQCLEDISIKAASRISMYFVVALLVSALSAWNGATAYCLAGIHSWEKWPAMMRYWALGDFIGIILIAPILCMAILTWKKKHA